ncbi:hypothetical protein B0H11DRAFT_1902342 [Mycena galericulata]|nr:hypothetical protein B0H11DRAFT_1902342 [Mycena galericulata]
MFFNDGQKKSPQYSGIPFEPFRTISGLIHSNPQRAFTIGLAVSPENPVGKPVEKWAKEPMHCNMMVLIHAPHVPGRRSTGEILLICEPNITDVEAREHKAKYILKSRMCEMLKEIGSSVKHVWANNKRKERNNVGICLTLALEWMVELVAGGVNGLGIERNDTQGTKRLKRVKIGNPLKKDSNVEYFLIGTPNGIECTTLMNDKGSKFGAEFETHQQGIKEEAKEGIKKDRKFGLSTKTRGMREKKRLTANSENNENTFFFSTRSRFGNAIPGWSRVRTRVVAHFDDPSKLMHNQGQN